MYYWNPVSILLILLSFLIGVGLGNWLIGAALGIVLVLIATAVDI